MISVSATGTTPIPPLRVVTEPLLIFAVVVGVAMVSVLGTMWIGRSMRSIDQHIVGGPRMNVVQPDVVIDLDDVFVLYHGTPAMSLHSTDCPYKCVKARRS